MATAPAVPGPGRTSKRRFLKRSSRGSTLNIVWSFPSGSKPACDNWPITCRGAALSRDDIGLRSGRRTNFFSRLEIVIRPASSYHVLDLAAKATVRNKEVFNRSHYQRLTEVDPTSFEEMIDLWVLEFAEHYSAKS